MESLPAGLLTGSLKGLLKGQAILVAKNQVRLAATESKTCQNMPIGRMPKTSVRSVQNQLSWCRINNKTTKKMMIIGPRERGPTRVLDIKTSALGKGGSPA